MDFKFQEAAIQQLQSLSATNVRSVLIEGCKGSGRRYLAKLYAELLSIPDCVIIEPTVSSISEIRSFCEYNPESPILVCIHDLETGVLGASYALLKFLEDSIGSAYLVITTSSVYNLLDTIVSRCMVVSLGSPSPSDIEAYLSTKDVVPSKQVKLSCFEHCISNFNDVEILVDLNETNLDYLKSCSNILYTKDTISTKLWNLMHFPDNSDIPISFMLKYLLKTCKSQRMRKHILNTIKDIESFNLPIHVILSKMLLECKYGG